MNLEKEHIAPITLLNFSSEKSFDDVIVDFEKQLGRFNQEKLLASSDLRASVKQMEGPSGLMIIAVLEMGKLLPSLVDSSTRTRQYLIGNPLIASQMAAFETLAALYAPPRVLVYTRDGKTWISYDKPSTVFGRFGKSEILQTAEDLDRKFEKLARNALIDSGAA
jgi:uncharacterized protein (DUF302 family)